VVKLITAAVDCGVSPGARTCVSVSHADWRALRHPMHDQGLGPAPTPPVKAHSGSIRWLRFRAVGIGSIASWNRDIEALRS
jgi:hypothetical protein